MRHKGIARGAGRISGDGCVRQHLHGDPGFVHVGQAPLAQLAEIGQPLRRHPLARGVGHAEVIAGLSDLLVHAIASIMFFQRDQPFV